MASGHKIQIDFSPNQRAKRFILRRAPRTGLPAVTVPRGASRKDAEAFVRRNFDWIEKHFADFTGESDKGPQQLTYGNSIPWNGRDVTLQPGSSVKLDADILYIPERRDLTRAVLDFITHQAKHDMARRVEHYCKVLGEQRDGQWAISKLRITDTTSRWGSCSSRAVISLNKRLMMAPEWVRNYVCAHEVAHLAEANHGPHFWSLCKALEPAIPPQNARDYLREHGPGYFTVVPK